MAMVKNYFPQSNNMITFSRILGDDITVIKSNTSRPIRVYLKVECLFYSSVYIFHHVTVKEIFIRLLYQALAYPYQRQLAVGPSWKQVY